MIVLPANATGMFFHCLARETGRLGHLYSPGAERGPWPWFPYALDNGCFSLWTPETNHFDEAAWRDKGEAEWKRLVFWASAAAQKPAWAIVPDWPGDWTATARKYRDYVDELTACGIPLAVAVQDGCTVKDVRNLSPTPAVICVGGSTNWKWATAEKWIKNFPRVHILRCNSPEKLYWLESLGCESCDGTGWNRGDRTQTRGLEEWARSRGAATNAPLWPHVSRARSKTQMTFA